MSPEASQHMARFANDVIDSSPSRELAMLLLSTLEQVARRLDAFDREVVACALRAAAIDLVAPEVARTQCH
jgi:hypothetical protein